MCALSLNYHYKIFPGRRPLMDSFLLFGLKYGPGGAGVAGAAGSGAVVFQVVRGAAQWQDVSFFTRTALHAWDCFSKQFSSNFDSL